MRCSFGSAILVIACVGSTAHAQRMMFPDDSSTTRRFRSVTLAIEVTPDHFAALDTVHITFHVTNDGGADVTFCVGRGYGMKLATAFDTVRSALLANQESCEGGPHTLGPGFGLAWDRSIVIPAIRSGGSAFLNAWADILDPLDCRVYGCGRAVIKAPGAEVQIVAPHSP